MGKKIVVTCCTMYYSAGVSFRFMMVETTAWLGPIREDDDGTIKNSLCIVFHSSHFTVS